MSTKTTDEVTYEEALIETIEAMKAARPPFEVRPKTTGELLKMVKALETESYRLRGLILTAAEQIIRELTDGDVDSAIETAKQLMAKSQKRRRQQ